MTLAKWFPSFTRDDLKWVWLQLLGLATLVVTNAVNVGPWFAYIGINLTDVEIHRITVAAAVALYLGGRYGSSPLPGNGVSK